MIEYPLDPPYVHEDQEVCTKELIQEVWNELKSCPCGADVPCTGFVCDDVLILLNHIRLLEKEIKGGDKDYLALREECDQWKMAAKAHADEIDLLNAELAAQEEIIRNSYRRK